MPKTPGVGAEVLAFPALVAVYFASVPAAPPRCACGLQGLGYGGPMGGATVVG